MGPWSESLPEKDRQNRHNTGWSNQFALPWEVSAYWNFTTRQDRGDIYQLEEDDYIFISAARRVRER